MLKIWCPSSIIVWECWPPRFLCSKFLQTFGFFHRHPKGTGVPGMSKIETYVKCGQGKKPDVFGQIFTGSGKSIGCRGCLHTWGILAINDMLRCHDLSPVEFAMEKWRCLNSLFNHPQVLKKYLPIFPWIPVFTRFYSPLPRICVSILGGDGSWLAWLWRPLACASSPSFAPWPIWKEGGTWWVNLEDHPSY